MFCLKRHLPSCRGWRPLSVPEVFVGEMTEGLIVGTPVFCYRAKPKGETKQKQTITKLLLWQLCGSTETLCLKLIWQKLPLRFRHEITRVNKHDSVRSLSVYPFPLWDEKKTTTHTHTATTNTNGSWLLLQLMRLSLSRDGSLPQLF